jgi:hypothetical protein
MRREAGRLFSLAGAACLMLVSLPVPGAAAEVSVLARPRAARIEAPAGSAAGQPAALRSGAPSINGPALADALRLAQARPATPTARADESSSAAKDAHFDSEYHDAEAAFPQFCREWAAKLRKREADNLEHIHWREQNGYEVGTYVGYSPIETCSCKRSAKGLPVGKLSYHEEIYYLVGHSIEEAKHAKPKVIGTTSTLELFNWNHHHWQY